MTRRAPAPGEGPAARGSGCASRAPGCGAYARRLLLAATALALAFLVYRFSHPRFGGHDFDVYYRAAGRFAAGAPLYVVDDLTLPYRYAPGVAALFLPFSPLPLATAKAIWRGLEAALAFGVVLLLDRRLRARAGWAAPLALLLLLRPMIDEMQEANANALALALAVGAWSADEGDGGVVAGLLLAVATALKVTPVLLALDWVLRRRVRPLAGLVAGLAVLAAAPVATYGIGGALDIHLAWMASERIAAPAWAASMVQNQSVWSIVAAAGGGRGLAALAATAVVAAAATARPSERRQALLLLAAALVTPYGWMQNFIFGVPVLALLLAASRRVAWAAATLAFAVWIPSSDVVGHPAERWLAAHKAVGLLVLAIFILARLAPATSLARKVRPTQNR